MSVIMSQDQFGISHMHNLTNEEFAKAQNEYFSKKSKECKKYHKNGVCCTADNFPVCEHCDNFYSRKKG